jgi:DNA-binding HxlR family transcriptional regulator
MMHYGQFCPLAKAAEIVAERWTPLVIQELLAGSRRFSDIRRGVPLMSQTLLSARLKELERVGIVERRGDDKHGREYHLTEAGVALGPALDQLSEWGLRYAQDPLEEGDLDVTILAWNIRRRVDPSVFPERRVTVHFEFTDVPKNKSQWWVVNDRGSVDLCPRDPGFPVDLYVTTDIRTMLAIWFGKLAWETGVSSGRVEVTGDRQLRDRLRSWLLLSRIRVTDNSATQSKTMAQFAANNPVPGRQPTAVLRQ